MDTIVQRLNALAESSPELKDAAQVYAAMLPILRDADLHASPIFMSREEARAKLELGLPLLHDLDLNLDYDSALGLMLKLTRALERVRVPAARPIRVGLEHGRLELAVLLPRVLMNDTGFVTTFAEGMHLDPALVWTIAQNALKPALRAWRRQLSPLVEGVEWHRGYCPICGPAATLGELQGNEQLKHLRCSACGADWQFLRMQCMYCGNTDHSTLSYLYPDGEREKRRIEVCDRCGGYLKVIAAFSPTPAELLPTEDLATLYLDYVAQERGYARVAIQ